MVGCVFVYFCEKEGGKENARVCSTCLQIRSLKDVFQWEMAYRYLSPWPCWKDAGLWTCGYVRPLLRVTVFMQKILAEYQIIK